MECHCKQASKRVGKRLDFLREKRFAAHLTFLMVGLNATYELLTSVLDSRDGTDSAL